MVHYHTLDSTVYTVTLRVDCNIGNFYSIWYAGTEIKWFSEARLFFIPSQWQYAQKARNPWNKNWCIICLVPTFTYVLKATQRYWNEEKLKITTGTPEAWDLVYMTLSILAFRTRHCKSLGEKTKQTKPLDSFYDLKISPYKPQASLAFI